MLKKDTTILLTGVTGLIGGELVRRLMHCPVGRILCLIRPGTIGDARARLLERLRLSDVELDDPAIECIEAVTGDVALPRFGMNDADFAKVSESVDLIVHCASELSFIRDAHCRETNIQGMHNLIDLARRCKRQPRIVHLSTVASCGAVTHQCMSEEDGSDPDNEHHNEYTRTKAVAEKVLRDSGYPALILRPSITLSAGLRARRFARAIAWFVPLLRHFEAIPIDPASRVDVVPVGFVADAIVELLKKEKLEYDCYNISAGEQDAMVVGEVSQFLDGFYERPQPLKLIAPSEWTREKHRQYISTAECRKMFSTLKYYLPFLNMDVVYDNTRLRRELGDAFPVITPVREYLGELLNLVEDAAQRLSSPRQTATA